MKRTEDQDHIRESVGKKVNAYAVTITALAGYWLLPVPMRPIYQYNDDVLKGLKVNNVS
ncbi:MAG: hypothetical protein WAM26_03715 [Nitrososphaeraceae archaeon]